MLTTFLKEILLIQRKLPSVVKFEIKKPHPGFDEVRHIAFT